MTSNLILSNLASLIRSMVRQDDSEKDDGIDRGPKSTNNATTVWFEINGERCYVPVHEQGKRHD